MNTPQFKPLVLQDLTASDIGSPVQYREKSDREYGVIVGYDDTYVYAHFNTGNTPICMLPTKLFVPIVNNSQTNICSCETELDRYNCTNNTCENRPKLIQS